MGRFPVLEGGDDASSCIIDGLLVLVCAVSEVTESEGWHETPALCGTPAERDHHTSWHRLSTSTHHVDSKDYKSFLALSDSSAFKFQNLTIGYPTKMSWEGSKAVLFPYKSVFQQRSKQRSNNQKVLRI